MLESSPPIGAEERSTTEKLAALSASRAHDDALDPAALLVFVMAPVRAWPSTYGPLARPTFADAAAQRATVVAAVRRLTVPQPANRAGANDK